MICELYKFFGIIPLDFNDMDQARMIYAHLDQESKTLFKESVELFVNAGFKVQNPAGLTTNEITEYFIAFNKYQANCWKNQAIIQRDILALPPEITSEELLKNVDNDKQQILDKIGQMAIRRDEIE